MAAEQSDPRPVPPTVLIADDSPLVLRMIEKMLAAAGFKVLTARDGLEACDTAIAEELSLVILDVMMPRMNGYQACRLLKTEPATRNLPVVILTSKDQAGDRFWGMETGADYYVTKNADPQRLVDLVKNILADEGLRPKPAVPEDRRSSVDILSRVNDLLDRKLFEATILSEIGRVARSLVQFDETFTSVMAVVGRVVDFSVAAMAFVEDDSLEVVLMQHRAVAPTVVEEVKTRLLEAIAAERSGKPFLRIHARLFLRQAQSSAPKENALAGFGAFPVSATSGHSGMLAVAGKAAARMTAQTQEFMPQVAQQAHIVLVNSRLFERVHDLSIRDGLTDLNNRRHTVFILAQEFERAGRYEEGVSILLVDIDHFKKINDELGHPAGDAVLHELASVLRDTFRSVDSVGRYGGEEFLAILPHTGRVECRLAAERIRKAVEGHAFRVGDRQVHITVSVGSASYPEVEVDSPDALIRVADRALYRAKEGGRNRVAP
jgi:two-component system, cell cycle response regulator